jgi:predicted GIY-YIG superfamily endonuclease
MRSTRYWLPYKGDKKWHRFDAWRPNSLPPCAACYVLSLDETVIYVGQTLNLRARFYSHRIQSVAESQYESAWGQLDGRLVLRAKFGDKYGDWAMREARLIFRLQPMFNLRNV